MNCNYQHYLHDSNQNEGERIYYLLPSKTASSPIIGSSMHGFRLPLLSDHPPANKIITIPNTDSNKQKICLSNSFNSVSDAVLIEMNRRPNTFKFVK